MSIFSVSFIILIIIIYNLYKIKKKEYSKLLDIKEGYINKNSLDINFIDNNFYVKQDKLITKNFTPSDTKYIYGNYNYSLENKFGYEISRIFDIEKVNSNLSKNINLLASYSDNYDGKLENNNIYMCLEPNYYKKILDKDILGKEVNYICSLYNLELYFVAREELNIKKFLDIRVYNEYRVLLDDTLKKILPEKLNIGIPNDEVYENSNLNSDLFLENTLNTDKYNLVYGDTNDLYSRMKIDKFNKNAVHVIFNISSYKNPYLIEFLRTREARIIGIDLRDLNVLKNVFPGCLERKLKMSKYIIKKGGTLENININIQDMEKKPTISFRVCLLCHKSANKKYIYDLTKKIFSNSQIMKKKLNNYQKTENDNVLEDILDPYQMFFLKNYRIGDNVTTYHKGAKDFYEEIGFITYEDKSKIGNFANNEMLYKSEISKLFNQ